MSEWTIKYDGCHWQPEVTAKNVLGRNVNISVFILNKGDI